MQLAKFPAFKIIFKNFFPCIIALLATMYICSYASNASATYLSQWLSERSDWVSPDWTVVIHIIEEDGDTKVIHDCPTTVQVNGDGNRGRHLHQVIVKKRDSSHRWRKMMWTWGLGGPGDYMITKHAWKLVRTGQSLEFYDGSLILDAITYE